MIIWQHCLTIPYIEMGNCEIFRVQSQDNLSSFDLTLIPSHSTINTARVAISPTVSRFLAMTVFWVSLNWGSSVTLLKIPKLFLSLDEKLQVRNRAFDVSVWHLNHNLWSLICNPLIPHVKYLLPQPYKGFFRCWAPCVNCGNWPLHLLTKISWKQRIY